MRTPTLATVLGVLTLHATFARADEPTPPTGSDSSSPTPSDAVTPPEPAPAEPPAAPAAQPAPTPDDLRDRIKELEDRVDEVEKQSALQRLEWSGDYRTTLGSYWYHGASPDSNPYARPTIVDLRNQEQWLHRVRLSVKAEPSSSFRFRGRFSVFKRFGTNTTTPSPQDFSQGRVPSDTSLRMDRFWLDWFITPDVALSFGRISYSDGSPAELRENLDKPDATWGLTMVDGEYETVDLTARIVPQLLVRGFYASWTFPRNDDLFSSSLFLDDGTKNLRILGGNADLTLPEAHLFAQLGAYYVPQFRPFAIPLPSPAYYMNPAANPSNAPPPLDGSLVFPSSLPDSLGSYGNLSLFAMVRDVAGFDLFVGGALGFLDPNNKAIRIAASRSTRWGSRSSTRRACRRKPRCSRWPARIRASSCTTRRETRRGSPGPRATSPSSSTSAVGGPCRPEAFTRRRSGSSTTTPRGTRFSFAQSTDLLTNKLAVRGSAWEAYLIQPITERAFLRFDWQYIDAQYTSGMPGNIAGATGFFGIPDSPMAPMSAHGGTSPPVDPGGQHLTALTMTLNTTF